MKDPAAAAPVVAAPAAPKARRRPPWAVLTAGLLLALIVLAALAPGLFASASPTAIDPVNALQGPGSAHLLGTDQLGRDLWSRLVHGAGPALSIGFGSTVIAMAGGAVLGLAAALGGRWADQLLMRAADVLLALPATLLALLAIAVLGTGTGNLVLALGFALVPGYGRMVRSEALLVRRSGYVEAAVALGVPRPLLILRHVLPNSLAPLLTLATVGFGTALIAASALSFLGLGPRPPSPEWGAMLAEGRGFLETAWWLGVFPGAAVTVTVVAVTVVGRHLQQRFTRRSA
ncbi:MULTISPECIES: ABC transporter permease [Kitasatospora]|uniref:Putative peptide ABC transporter permease protein n=1 Tax=Kitasatospora setae (strain ATCC 33774 / DSM 43861 / JCM 3304 / KCC A-0304 / NBRC 14216 / KM-6054) TaxID=452652 RepID=E4N2D8_KITSK|nr:ABC transporter permease [Kitasatospora setae]BAJ32322.1 putative peptide ABC transporter permease protein [Kitasatospora setae KM-6054]